MQINKAVVRESIYLLALLAGILVLLTLVWLATGSPRRASWVVYVTYVVGGFFVIGVRAFRRRR